MFTVKSPKWQSKRGNTQITFSWLLTVRFAYAIKKWQSKMFSLSWILRHMHEYSHYCIKKTVRLWVSWHSFKYLNVFPRKNWLVHRISHFSTFGYFSLTVGALLDYCGLANISNSPGMTDMILFGYDQMIPNKYWSIFFAIVNK